jgi:hypothetical protein
MYSEQLPTSTLLCNMLLLCPFSANINQEVSRNTDNVHEAQLTSKEATCLIAQNQSWLSHIYRYTNVKVNVSSTNMTSILQLMDHEVITNYEENFQSVETTDTHWQNIT